MIKRSFTNNEMFSHSEKEIKEIYIQEFNDLFPYILKYQSGKFLTNLFKRVKLTFIQKFNDIPNSSILDKIEKYIIETLYTKEYQNAYEIFKQIKNKLESSSEEEINNLIFNGHNFIKHCNKNENPIHSCGIFLS